jgi:acyl transferase domain-containing protein
MERKAVDSPNAVAIIGMSGRFPGARDLGQFWQNLAGAVESVKFFSDEELLAAGVPGELVHNPEYVKAAPVLDDVDLFDARFFQFSPREATITDPQHRLMLECAWEAMEHAGYCGDSYKGAIGVFAGAGPSMSTYLASDTHVNSALFGPSGTREHIGNDKDYLCTRVSYKLNLRGPSINVQTACSTSLVAVHLACQSLLMGESDVALAGGVTARVPQAKGHLIRDNAMASHDGHCRPFDADANGTIFGSGVGVVVLKRLANAIRDGDNIHAVIRGSAVNNDGTSKISFWASSAEGQMPAMIEAMAVAEVNPETITMVEAHGTGTSLGDPVEIQALTKAFRTGTDKRGYCAIGSVKSNVGHLDSAAGVAGLIKAVLALKHHAIPPSLHFQTPNPRIDFPSTPFFVNTECRGWDSDDSPRRAAVNSLGIGGTNAFVVLEEAPPPEPVAVDVDRPVHILPLTAKSARALGELVTRYVEHFKANPQLRLADACFTAAAGRGQFPHRVSVTAESVPEATDRLEQFQAGNLAEGVVRGEVPRNALPKIALLCSGQLRPASSKYHVLYRTQPTFRREIDRCGKAVLAQRGELLLPRLFPQEGAAPEGAPLAAESVAALALNVALAELLRRWGAEAILTAGVGPGEVSAACIAEAISLDDAIALSSAGPDARRQYQLTDPNSEPGIRVVSGTNGQVVTPEVATSDYWQSIDWATADADRAVETLIDNRAEVLLQLGAESDEWDTGRHRLDETAQVFLSGLAEGACPWRHLLHRLAVLYARGTPVDWNATDQDYPRRRVELPTYPFQRKRFWSEAAPVALSGRYPSCNLRLQEGIDPLLGRRVYLAHQPDQILYEMVLDTSSPLLDGEAGADEPRTVPESAFCELASAAAKAATEADSVQLEDLATHEPLVLKPHRSRIVQLALLPDQENVFRLEISSRDAVAQKNPQQWTHHVSARLRP